MVLRVQVGQEVCTERDCLFLENINVRVALQRIVTNVQRGATIITSGVDATIPASTGGAKATIAIRTAAAVDAAVRMPISLALRSLVGRRCDCCAL